MTKRLHAVNRWCVTGTPIQQGPEGNHSNIIIYSPRDLFLQDIYGLLLFLGVQPYCAMETLALRPVCPREERSSIGRRSQAIILAYSETRRP